MELTPREEAAIRANADRLASASALTVEEAAACIRANLLHVGISVGDMVKAQARERRPLTLGSGDPS